MKTVTERFLAYVGYETTSCEANQCCPSTPNQRALAPGTGGGDAGAGPGRTRGRTSTGYCAPARIPGKGDPAAPAVGLIAHMDTSDAVPGGPDACPRGAELGGRRDHCWNAAWNDRRPRPPMPAHLGQELLVTDGAERAGRGRQGGRGGDHDRWRATSVAIPMCRTARSASAFTPGRGDRAGARICSTWRASARTSPTPWTAARWASIEYENFNAACGTGDGARLEHPSRARREEPNEQRRAHRPWSSTACCPPAETPAHTEGYEGFYHLCEMQGDEELDARLQLYYARPRRGQAGGSRRRRMRRHRRLPEPEVR